METYKEGIQLNYSKLVSAAHKGRKPLRDKLILSMLAQPSISYELLASLRAHEIDQDAAGRFWIRRRVPNGGQMTLPLSHDSSRYMLEYLESKRLHGTDRLVLGISRSAVAMLLGRLRRRCGDTWTAS